METTRIQRLLHAEYGDLAVEPVLLESPFAETTREGQGVREVALGLTRSRLLVAVDVLGDGRRYWCARDVDPSIETLQLITAYPLELVQLSVYRRRRRKAIKARLADGQARYYELGGLYRSRRRWRLWCEHVRELLRSRALGSSLSETSVAPSSSYPSYVESVNPQPRRCKKTHRSQCRLAGAGEALKPPTWTSKYLFLEPERNERYRPVAQPRLADMSLDRIKDYLGLGQPVRNRAGCDAGPAKIPRVTDPCEQPLKVRGEDGRRSSNPVCNRCHRRKNRPGKIVERFGGGAGDNCRTRLCMTDTSASSISNFERLQDSGLRVWENARNHRSSSRKTDRSAVRTPTIAPTAHFFRGLGPWTVGAGERASLQTRRSVSCVVVQRQPADAGLRLPISRRQLATSRSLASLVPRPVDEPGLLFWTPNYWYRPRGARSNYRELRDHLADLRDYLERGSQAKLRCNRTSRDRLRWRLKLRQRASLWDLESSALARQLTLVDRELFTRIDIRELGMVVGQRTSRGAANIAAWMAFAHRIAGLIVTELLGARELRARARLLARLISAANKCLAMGNFQSAGTIVAGLQAPAVYRLTETWSYLKIHHATRWLIMEKLCRLFRDTRAKGYRRAWRKAQRCSASIPYIGDLLERLFCEDDEREIEETRTRARRRQRETRAEFLRKLTGRAVREALPSDVAGVADWLENCQRQAAVYDFPRHTWAWEFLLKARYQEDRENFFCSLEIEKHAEDEEKETWNFGCT